MSDNLRKVREYLSLVETLSDDVAKLRELLHPEFLQTEFPNTLNKSGQERGVEGCEKGMELARQILVSQKYEILGVIGDGPMAIEAVWTGELKAGTKMKARFCMIFEFREGRIHRQRNYDCFEPF